jgi:hypothetical protein
MYTHLLLLVMLLLLLLLLLLRHGWLLQPPRDGANGGDSGHEVVGNGASRPTVHSSCLCLCRWTQLLELPPLLLRQLLLLLGRVGLRGGGNWH